MSAAVPPARALDSTLSSCVPSRAQRALLLPLGSDLAAATAAAAAAAAGAGAADGAGAGGAAGAACFGAVGVAAATGGAATTAGLAGAAGAAGATAAAGAGAVEGAAAGAGAALTGAAAAAGAAGAAGLGAGVAGVTMTAPDFMSCFCSTLLSQGRSWYTLPHRYSAWACSPVSARTAHRAVRVRCFMGKSGASPEAADANATRPARTAGSPCPAGWTA